MRPAHFQQVPDQHHVSLVDHKYACGYKRVDGQNHAVKQLLHKLTYRVGVWFGFVRSALLLAVGLC